MSKTRVSASIGVKALMIEKGVSAKRLASALGVNRTWIYIICDVTSDKKISLDILGSIGQFLEVEPSEIIAKGEAKLKSFLLTDYDRDVKGL